MAPPLAINKEQILDTFYGIWSTMVSSFSTATAYYLSTTLNGSLSHKRSSPIMAAHIVTLLTLVCYLAQTKTVIRQ